ncbi:CRISPR-associated protein Cas4 [Candidatus Bipolaricaulota sp. J31]
MNMTLHYMEVYVLSKGDKCPICGTTSGGEIPPSAAESAVFKGSPPPKTALTCQSLVYRASRRRREVAFTPELRAEVEQAVREVRDLLQRMSLPPPVADTRCRDCSLIGSCLPFVPKTLADLTQGGGT